MKNRKTAYALVALASAASASFAQAPVMPAIDFPIDLASVATVVATAGGTMLLIWAGVHIGFKLARKLLGRVTKSV